MTWPILEDPGSRLARRLARPPLGPCALARQDYRELDNRMTVQALAASTFSLKAIAMRLGCRPGMP